MCGRFTLTSSKEELEELLPLFDVPELEPRFNIAPTQLVAAARVWPESERREIGLLKWGLVPSWADDPKMGFRMINARADTVATKPAFRAAFRRRRCLIVADGFYEWKLIDGKKQPFWIHLKEGGPFTLAGLWEHWERDGHILETCTIITTEANELVKPLHDRMPVIVARGDHERWLDPDNQTGQGLLDLLRPYSARDMDCFPVSLRVNNPRHDDPSCVLPLAS